MVENLKSIVTYDDCDDYGRLIVMGHWELWDTDSDGTHSYGTLIVMGHG